MNESKSISFIEIFTKENLWIEIPKIQRDYAQGRIDESASEIRENFLLTLKEYLSNGSSHNHLDFIYGDVDKNGKLIILDGQQRITTLFLLHWYLSLVDNQYDCFKECLISENKVRFTYNTRESSNQFCHNLVVRGKEVYLALKENPENKGILSKTIEDQTWFFINWKNDLTIKSMLVMLDAIQEKFSVPSGYYSKLTDPINPCIDFNFLPMREQGLTDELYIKMNARGRELTRFENLKSKIISKLDEKKEKNLKDEFSKNIDTVWTDFFWSLPSRTKENQFDTMLLNFFEVIFLNRYIIESHTEEYENVKKYIDMPGSIPFKDIFSFPSFSDYVKDCIVILETIIANTKKQECLLDGKLYYDEEATFNAFINHSFSDAAYSERLMFFAYCYYITSFEGKINSENFTHWMRVAKNIVNNLPPINSVTDFCNTFKSIRRLLDNCKGLDIYDCLSIFDDTYAGISSSLLVEEKLKIILLTNGWNQEIITGEKHSYFKGQLKFALDYSGITKNLGASTIYSPQIEECRPKFEYAIKIMFSLFESEGLSKKAKENCRLQRALLAISKGCYLMSYGYSNRWSFLNDSHRDFSWKNYLQGDNNQENARGIRNYFFQLVDNEMFNLENLESLELIANTHKTDCPMWVKMFIENPEVLYGYDPLHIGAMNMVSFDDEEDAVYILSQMQMNSWHSELYTEVKYLQYRGRNFDFSPFARMGYELSADKENMPYLYFAGFSYLKENYMLQCVYGLGGNIILRFSNESVTSLCLVNIIIQEILQKEGFIEKNNYFVKEVKLDSLDGQLNSLMERLNDLSKAES